MIYLIEGIGSGMMVFGIIRQLHYKADALNAIIASLGFLVQIIGYVLYL